MAFFASSCTLGAIDDQTSAENGGVDAALPAADESAPSDGEVSLSDQIEIAADNPDSARLANTELLSLANISYIVEVEVKASHPLSMIDPSDGSKVEIDFLNTIEAEVRSITWAKGHQWNLGEKEAIDAPAVGTIVILSAEDGWAPGEGDVSTIAVETLTIVTPDVVGHVSYVVDDPNAVGNGIGRLVAAGRSQRGQADREDRDVLATLAAAAAQWTDESVLLQADAELPPGLLKSAASELGLSAAQGAGGARGGDANGLALKAWTETPASERQLPVSFDELPGLREHAAGRGLVEAQVAVVDADPELLYAVSFRSTGVLGPFATDPAIEVASMLGVMPKAGRLELLTWPSDTDPAPDSATVAAEVTLKGDWSPDDGEVIVFQASDPAYDLVVMSADEHRRLMTDRVEAVDPGPRSEPENK